MTHGAKEASIPPHCPPSSPRILVTSVTDDASQSACSSNTSSIVKFGCQEAGTSSRGRLAFFVALPSQTIMLRTLTSPEPELIRLCHYQAWPEVLRRSVSHPLEAQPSEASLRGEGSTAVATALRCGAPLQVVKALVDANPHQLALTHRQRGSVLHEALRHQCDIEIVNFVLTAMLEYQNRTKSVGVNHSPKGPATSIPAPRHGSDDRCGGRPPVPSFQHVIVQEQRLLQFPHLLGTADDLHRTPLHHFVERAQRLILSSPKCWDITWQCFQCLVQSYPDAIVTPDQDGNTPLIVLLQAPRVPSIGRVETEIARMVKLMLSASPGASAVTGDSVRPGKRPQGCWGGGPNVITSLQSRPGRMLFHPLSRRPSSGGARSSGLTPSLRLPAYIAVLHGRSHETIQCLLDDHHHAGHSCGSIFVTNYQEVLLHVAVTTRAPLSFLYELVMDCPTSLLVPDTTKLTPIDWLWFRYVVDLHTNPIHALSTRLMSRRRFLPMSFRDKHQQATAACLWRKEDDPPIPPTASFDPPPPILANNPVAFQNLQDDLWQRLQLVLPVAASACGQASMTTENNSIPAASAQTTQSWSLLHAACYVPCPLALVRMILAKERSTAEQHHVHFQDSHMKRYPLHYACTKVGGHCLQFKVGVRWNDVQTHWDPSPVVDVANSYPHACRVRDMNQQLPLHIVIDSLHDIVQRRREKSPETTDQEPSSSSSTRNNDDELDLSTEQDQEYLRVLDCLLLHYPTALERRDGVSKLYPFQQAAAAYDTPVVGMTTAAVEVKDGFDDNCTSSLTAVYLLLRRNPTVLSRCIV